MKAEELLKRMKGIKGKEVDENLGKTVANLVTDLEKLVVQLKKEKDTKAAMMLQKVLDKTIDKIG